MKKMLLLSLLFASTGYSQINNQFLNCVPGSFQLEVCKLVNLEFFPKSSVELNFKVDFINNCSGTPISIGVQDSNSKATYLFQSGKGIQSLAFNGFGPVVSVDPTPKITYTGGFNLDCDIRVTGVTTDVSDNTKQVLDKTIDLLKAFNLIIDKAKEIDSLATTIETLITKIDVGSLKNLVMNLYDNTVALRDSYTKQNDDGTKDALNDVIADIKVKICSSPPLRAGNEKFCTGVEPTNPPPPNPVQELATSIGNIKTASKTVVETIKSRFSDNVVYSVGALAVAKPETKKAYMKKVCQELDKAAVQDEACEPYKDGSSQ